MKPVIIVCLLIAAAIPRGIPQNSGVIAGSIRNAENSSAVAGAKVRLEVVASYSAVPAVRSLVTDSSGRFVFGDLPIGTYRLFASAVGFAAREYGQQESNGPGTPIALAADQRISGLNVQLVPVGTISGEVRTNDGMPARNVSVKVTRTFFTAMGRVQQIVKATTTDDRGKYRLFGLSPGPYFLSAGSDKPPFGRSSDAVIVSDYAVQFYPGVDTIDDARLIDVTAGGELNINLKTHLQKSVSVRGTIVDELTSQPPEKVHWQLIYRQANGITTSFAPEASYNPVTGDFEFRNVWLGSYVLEASTTVDDTASRDAGEAAWAVFPVARIPIVVRDSGLDNVHLIQTRPFAVTGRVHIDGNSDPPPMSGTVNVYPIEPESPGRTPPGAKIAADGTFRIIGLVPGDYVLRLEDELGNSFYTKNITYNANDILNFPWHLSGPGTGTVDIVRRTGVARLTGTASNNRSAPAAGARIVLLPEARFRSDLYGTAVADRNGRFTMSAIAPGEYKLFAFEALAMGEEFIPEVMRNYESEGVRLHIVESAGNNLDIRAVPKP